MLSMRTKSSTEAARAGTTNTVNVKKRLRRAEAILGEL